MATHSQEVDVYDGVSTADVPSAGWGWSELTRRSIILSGVLGGIFLLLLQFGNHEGHVETIWLATLAALTLIGTFFFAFRPKLTQRQTLTARNKPVGHIEPQWADDQKNLTGVYAKLTDEELRAWNMDTRGKESISAD